MVGGSFGEEAEAVIAWFIAIKTIVCRETARCCEKAAQLSKVALWFSVQCDTNLNATNKENRRSGFLGTSEVVVLAKR